MTPHQLAAPPGGARPQDAGPRDRGGLRSHRPRKAREDNQDQLLVAQLRRQIVFQLGSLACDDQLGRGQRVALLMLMVADGVAAARKGPEARPIALCPGAFEPTRTSRTETTSATAVRLACAVDRQSLVLWAKTWKALKEQWEKQCAA
jgi:hypothetical protein